MVLLLMLPIMYSSTVSSSSESSLLASSSSIRSNAAQSLSLSGHPAVLLKGDWRSNSARRELLLLRRRHRLLLFCTSLILLWLLPVQLANSRRALSTRRLAAAAGIGPWLLPQASPGHDPHCNMLIMGQCRCCLLLLMHAHACCIHHRIHNMLLQHAVWVPTLDVDHLEGSPTTSTRFTCLFVLHSDPS